MQKYWVFEAKTTLGGFSRVCVAFADRCTTFDDAGYVQLTASNSPAGIERFHGEYTITSGSVPPWLEKPLPRQWPLWVSNRSRPSDGELMAMATDEKVVVVEGQNQTHTWISNSFQAEGFHRKFVILGSPDLPDWLKTEDAK